MPRVVAQNSTEEILEIRLAATLMTTERMCTHKKPSLVLYDDPEWWDEGREGRLKSPEDIQIISDSYCCMAELNNIEKHFPPIKKINKLHKRKNPGR